MIITISHQKGGVGKSTLVWNMIIEYSKNRKIKIIDLDIQKTITYSLQVRNNQNLDTSNIILISPNNEKEMVNELKNIKEDELLFIDSGGFDSSLNRIAISVSDILLTPVSSKFYELLGLKEYEKILIDLSNKLGKKLLANVILNKINPNTKDLFSIEEFINDSEYFNLMKSIIRQRVDYENSPGLGKSVVEYNSSSKATKEFKKFKKELSSIIEL